LISDPEGHLGGIWNCRIKDDARMADDNRSSDSKPLNLIREEPLAKRGEQSFAPPFFYGSARNTSLLCIDSRHHKVNS
ncbi:MAG: hypothetical protein ACYSOR_08560, partial [Planctomycetota bacterium]